MTKEGKVQSSHSGLFISFEGGEGVGKSTQARLLATWLKGLGYHVRLAHEPGGTKIGEQIRGITHNPTNTMMDDRAEALLFAASRAQTVTETYKRYLQKGYIVIADRYIDSSLVYQGIARQLGYEFIKTINEFAINGLWPDITFLLDMDYRLGQKRRHDTDKIDRMDMEKKAFYETVHQGYRDLAARENGRIKLIDGDQPIKDIQSMIREQVSSWLKKHPISGAK